MINWCPTAVFRKANGRRGDRRRRDNRHLRRMKWSHFSFVVQQLVAKPSMSVVEMVNALRRRYPLANITARVMEDEIKRHGYTFKKLKRVAKQADPMKEAQYLLDISHIAPHRLVFVDESG